MNCNMLDTRERHAGGFKLLESPPLQTFGDTYIIVSIIKHCNFLRHRERHHSWIATCLTRGSDTRERNSMRMDSWLARERISPFDKSKTIIQTLTFHLRVYTPRDPKFWPTDPKFWSTVDSLENEFRHLSLSKQTNIAFWPKWSGTGTCLGYEVRVLGRVWYPRMPKPLPFGLKTRNFGGISAFWSHFQIRCKLWGL